MQPEWRTCPRWDTRCPGTGWLLTATRRRVAPHRRLSRRDRNGRKNRCGRRARKNRRGQRAQNVRSDTYGISRGIVAGQSAGIPFGGYARLVGALHYAPSLRSVAGLLLALALESRLREPPPPSLLVHRGASNRDRAFGRGIRRRSTLCRPRAARVFRPPPASTSRANFRAPTLRGSGRSEFRRARALMGGTRTPVTYPRGATRRCSYESV